MNLHIFYTFVLYNPDINLERNKIKMKKGFVIVLTLALLIVGATVAFAADVTDGTFFGRRADMAEYREEHLSQLVEDGVITQEEADLWIQQMEDGYDIDDCPYFDEDYNYEDGYFHGGMMDRDYAGFRGCGMYGYYNPSNDD